MVEYRKKGSVLPFWAVDSRHTEIQEFKRKKFKNFAWRLLCGTFFVKLFDFICRKRGGILKNGRLLFLAYPLLFFRLHHLSWFFLITI